MLSNILSSGVCAECRICCTFDKYDIWETPVIDSGTKENIHKAFPQLKFVSKGTSGAYIFNMEDTWDDKRELFICPALDPDRGCILGRYKPFDCKIWPYRIMELGGKWVISIASVCPELYSRPLNTLVDELDRGLADIIFAEAEKNPAIVKPYEQGYPILKVRGGAK